jgi:hypothetical protein
MSSMKKISEAAPLARECAVSERMMTSLFIHQQESILHGFATCFDFRAAEWQGSRRSFHARRENCMLLSASIVNYNWPQSSETIAEAKTSVQKA